jgi:hypothetical protein
MFWTIVGLLIATAVSVEGAVSSDRDRKLKLLLIGFALTGSFVAGISGYDDNAGKAHVEAELTAANQQLEAQKPILELVNLTVGDLGTLNQLSAGEKYYVRICAGSKNDMESYLTRIEASFKGARSSGLVSVRQLRADCSPNDPHVSCWGLVFGSNLNPAAAEVFERLADENGFPPPGQHAYMQPESQH